MSHRLLQKNDPYSADFTGLLDSISQINNEHNNDQIAQGQIISGQCAARSVFPAVNSDPEFIHYEMICGTEHVGMLQLVSPQLVNSTNQTNQMWKFLLYYD